MDPQMASLPNLCGHWQAPHGLCTEVEEAGPKLPLEEGACFLTSVHVGSLSGLNWQSTDPTWGSSCCFPLHLLQPFEEGDSGP